MKGLVYILVPSFVFCLGMSVNPDFPIDVGSIISTSPIITDIDNNGFADIIIPSWDNKIHILLQDRSGFGEITDDSLDIALSGENLTPATISLDDRTNKIVWATDEGIVYVFSYNEPPASGDRFVLSGHNPVSSPACYRDDKYILIAQSQPNKGILLINLKTNEKKTMGDNSSVTTAPAIADINGDKIPDVVFGTKEGVVYAFSADDTGNPKWSYRTTSEFIGGVSLADVDRDGKLETFLCSIDGMLYGIDDDGSPLTGFPVDVSDGQLTHGVVTTPAIGDMNGDKEYEICVSTGIQQSQSGTLKLYNKNGMEIGSYTTKKGGFISSPIMANLDNDNELEVFAISYSGEMVALNSDGTMVDGFPKMAPEGTYSSTPAYSDLDNDGYGELAIVNEKGELYLYDLDTVYFYSPWSMDGGNCYHNGLSSTVPQESPQIEGVQREGYVNLKWKEIPGIETWVLSKKYEGESEFKKICELASNRNSYKDAITNESGSITYRLEGNVNHIVTLSDEIAVNIEETPSSLPKASITNAYPNPFPDKITIAFNVSGKSQNIRIAIYDVSGKLVRLLKSEETSIGDYIVTWDGVSESGVIASTGVYFCRLESEGGTSTRSIILIR
jgi:hypothetical protein